MLNDFKEFIEKEELFNENHKLLLAVSGGLDSVVLANLVDQLDNSFGIAHCNFKLRGEDSEADEHFVANLADLYRVPFYVTSFNTREYASEKGISIEMAARDLRYDWFEKIRAENEYDYILVAHHLDDVLETFILNLSRGTGIRGLSGIKPMVGKVVRPLLFAQRKELLTYARTYGVRFNYDISNSDQNIRRNKVRHSILPLLEEINPSFRKNLHRTISYLNETKNVFYEQVESVRNKIVIQNGDWVEVSIEALRNLNPISTYLFEILRPFNFKGEVVNDIINALDSPSGTQFFSVSHRLVIDREKLIVTAIEEPVNDVFYIEKDQEIVSEPIDMRISVQRYSEDYKIPNSSNVAVFDFDELSFPLIIRKWKKGEYFKPLGLDGFKKLSDFFIDQKYSIPEKENAWLMASGNKIAWVIGKRIDDRFKLTPDTKLVLRIELLNQN